MYEVSYKDLPREEADAKAIQDIRDYCSEKMWEALLIDTGAAAAAASAEAFRGLNMAMAFAGISGYPVHAFGRRYCLASYRAWMAAGSKPIQTDEKGFPIND